MSSQGILSLSVSLSCTLYGVGIVLFTLSIRVLRHKRREQNQSLELIPLLPVLCGLLLCSTIHIALGLSEVWRVHTVPPTIPSTPATRPTFFLPDISLWYQAAQVALYATSNLIAAGILIFRIWRLYNVFQRPRRLIIAPIFLHLGTTLSGYAVVYLLHNDASASGRSIRHIFTAFASGALCTNLGVPTLMVLHLLRQGFRGPDFWHVFLVAVETGASIAIPLFIMLLLHIFRSPYYFIFLAAMTPTTLMVTSLAIVHTEMRPRPQEPSGINTCHCIPKPKQRRRTRRASPTTPVQARPEAPEHQTPEDAPTTPAESDIGLPNPPVAIPPPPAALFTDRLRSTASLNDLTTCYVADTQRTASSAAAQPCSCICLCQGHSDKLARLV